MNDYKFTTDFVSGFTDQWRMFLTDIQGRPGSKMLEIGCFEGRSTLWFLENILTGSGSSITCVDLFIKPYEDLFDHNISISGRAGQVTKLFGQSQTVLTNLNRMFDAVYVDDGHREQEVREDLCQAWRLSKSGAVLILDDYLWEPHLPLTERPMRAIDDFLLEQCGKYALLHKNYQVIIRKN